MTIKRLIGELSRFDPKLEVVIPDEKGYPSTEGRCVRVSGIKLVRVVMNDTFNCAYETNGDLDTTLVVRLSN